jgi:hypothetical protein
VKKGPPPNFVRDRNSNVVNGLRVQRAKTKKGRKFNRYFAFLDDGRRKYFGNSDDKPSASMTPMWRPPRNKQPKSIRLFDAPSGFDHISIGLDSAATG